jgi:hypothetical protein
MPSAIKPLANITLGSTATSVTFSSISGAYRDLLLVIGGTIGLPGTAKMRFNNDSGGNYNYVTMFGTGSTTGSGNYASSTEHQLQFNGVWWSTVGSLKIQVFDYSATNKHKSTLVRNDSAAYATEALAGRWASTAAITSLQVSTFSADTFAAGSTFALYGVSA